MASRPRSWVPRAARGGVKQVTYNGHPLYRFVKDKAPRQTKGQDLNAFGADWYVVSAAGKKIDKGGS